MKHFLIVCSALLLSSCINVDDFGDFWNKASVDPNIAGLWKNVSVADKNGNVKSDKIEETHFFVEDSAYVEFDYRCFLKDRLKHCSASTPDYPLKTLILGSYQFLIHGPQKHGMILYRYQATQNTMKIYDLNVDAVWDFLDKNYPGHQNISKRYSVTGQEGKKTPFLAIDLMDDKVAEMLASIPDNDIYWSLLDIGAK
jgi:hypothetical protein